MQHTRKSLSTWTQGFAHDLKRRKADRSMLNFKFEHQRDWPADRYHSSYRIREDFSHEVMTDALRFVFLELGRFNKRIWATTTT